MNHHSPSEPGLCCRDCCCAGRQGRLKAKRGGRNAMRLIQKKKSKKNTYHTKSTAKKWPAGGERKRWMRFGKRCPGLFLFCALCFGAAQTIECSCKTNHFQTSLLIKNGQLQNACETNHIRSVHINSEKRAARTTYETEQKLTTRSPSSYLCSCRYLSSRSLRHPLPNQGASWDQGS